MRHDPHFVEELTVRDSDPVGRMMPLSEIEPDPGQPRTNMGNLEDLAASIRDKGVLEPILVRPLHSGQGDHKPYRIISGERRYHAAAQAGLFEVPVIEMEVSEQEALEIALVENLQRKDLTPFEESEGYQALGERFDYTHEQIAKAVGKSRSMVTESLLLLQMTPRVRDTANALGVTSKSVLLEVLKSTDDENAMIQTLEQVAERGLTREDLRRAAVPAAKSTAKHAKPRRKPYTFKFRAPDKTFNLSLSFRKTAVDRDDLIGALEHILADLRAAERQDS
jgi:ParB family chromosome partitioning protein